MVTFNPEVVAEHAQHVHLFATQLDNAETHAMHDSTWTTIALGGLGILIFTPMTGKLDDFGTSVQTLSERADDVKKRIDSTVQIHRITEQANVELIDKTKTSITDPDLFHAPKSINDFPDMGISGDIGQFASNCPQYAEAGSIPVVLGAVGLALDVLGYALDPVGNVFGELAGLIIDLIWPAKELLDWLLGDPGALQDASATYEQIGQYLSETAHTYAASLAQITPATWDEPGASDVYRGAADSLVQLAVGSGTRSVEISGDILMIGSVLGDVRSHVFDHIVGFVMEAVFEAALGTSFAAVTFGASLGVAAGVIETEAAMTIASIGVEMAAAAARLGAAAMVAHAQSASYQKLIADIKN
ncbi:hypothetical protein SAMN05443575_2318 [Jatrophihabitans endophyticus]|uniref:Excreted virulence factor EspC, type VII ESX diderm n=1 Tax=Jatrophihabitans endophyticus TaxID=1206085 RepID=A0A1M5L124_9ACTN|nr:hypothetical protein [Jatrophihabitans endophyticus]SHG58696.1 hypothetical protein SAMN05443575_2318 [Jatrophihabitans endophyticus]